MKIKYLFICILWIFVCGVGYAQTTWTGAISGDMTVSGNWRNGVPTSSRSGIIQTCNCNYTPTLTADVNFQTVALTISNGGKIQLNTWKLTTRSITIITNSVINSNGGGLITNIFNNSTGSVFNGNINITATTLTNISGSTFSGNVNITATTLTNIAGSIFSGNAKIIVSGSGGTNGGNTFNGNLDLELSSGASGALSLNKTIPSIHGGICTFTNNSAKILILASHAQDLGESTFAQNCVINNNNGGTINVGNGGARVKVTDIVLNNTQGTINTAAINTANILTVTNSLRANFVSTNSANTCVINLNNVIHSRQADNVVINASTGILGITNSNFACPVSFLRPSIPTTNNTSVGIIGSTFGGNVDIAVNTLTNISGSKFSGNANIIATTLANISGSTFNGDVKIIVNGSGGTDGGNVFNGQLGSELSSGASDALSLNRKSPSIHRKECTFTNNSAKILTIASHAQVLEESAFAQNCVINNNNSGIVNVVNGRTRVRFSSKVIINNLAGQTSISNTSGVCIIRDILINNSGGTISTADNKESQLTVTNSLKANFIGTITNVGTINLNKVTHVGDTDNIIIDASNGTLNVTNSAFACNISLKGGSNLVSTTNNTFNNAVFIASGAGSFASKLDKFNDFTVTHNGTNTSIVNINTVTCNGNFVVEGTSTKAINFTNNNIFKKDITLNKIIAIGTNNANIIILNGIADQTVKSDISIPVQIIPTLVVDKTAGDVFIKTPISISTKLNMSNRAVIDCTTGTLDAPMLEIGTTVLNGINPINYMEQIYIKGAVRKILISNETFSFTIPVGLLKCQPLTLSSTAKTPSNQSTPLSITVQYNNPPNSGNTPTSVNNLTGKFISNLEHWKFKANFLQSSVAFTLDAVSNTQIFPSGGVIKSFGWELAGQDWKEIKNNIVNGVLNSNQTLSPIQFNKEYEIRLGYDAVLELDVSEVAPKDFTFSSNSTNLTNLPPATTAFQTSIRTVMVRPSLIPPSISGTIVLDVQGATTPSKIKIPYPLLSTSTITVNRGSSLFEDLAPEFYKITSPAVGQTKLQFYKTSQTSTTPLGITTNLSEGIKLSATDLIFTFAMLSKYKLEIYTSTNATNTFATVAMSTATNTLVWALPGGIPSGSYKFTLTDLTTSTIVYQGQFIK